MEREIFARKENGQGLAKREQSFPKEIEARFAVILSSFNASPKAVTLLLLSESLTDTASLARQFRELTAQSPMAKTDKKIAPGYCQWSLCPIGLVAQEVTIDDFGAQKTVGYSLTDAGKKYGRALAAFFLDFEARHNLSLFAILGATQTSGEHRAPYLRARILKVLADVPQRQADICQKLTINGVTAKSNLKALAKAQVIDYQAVTPQTDQVQVEYRLRPKTRLSEVRTVANRKTLTEEVARICQNLADMDQAISCENVYAFLTSKIKDKARWRKLNEMSLRATIRGVLSGLAKQGFLERGTFKGGEVLSWASLTEKGRLIVGEFLGPLEEALADGPVLEQLSTEVLQRVREQLPDYAVKTAQLYYSHPQSFKVRQSEDYKSRMLALFGQTPESTAGELVRELGLGEGATRNYLRLLFEQNLLTREKRKGVYYWRLKRD